MSSHFKIESVIILLMTLLVVSPQIASAGQKAKPKTSAKLKLAKEVFKYSGTDKELKVMVESLLAMRIKASPLPLLVKAKLGLKNSKASSERITNEIANTLQQDFDIANKLEENFAKAYSKEFSKKELETMLKFYKSPAGRKALKIGGPFTKDIKTLKKEILTPKLDKALKEALEQAKK